jgi:putative oxygen-independent coproporphyrinogen III oxidase
MTPTTKPAFFAQNPTQDVGINAKKGSVGEWTAEPGFGVYVHIPFCVHRCHYCDFNTYEDLDALHRPYVEALVRHVETYAPGREFPDATSVFFGGGTPTVLDASDLGRILDAVRARVGLAPGPEVTVEANPETVDAPYFERLLGAGVNRVSIGVQSLVEHVLNGLGRTHSPEIALDAVGEARRAGVEDLNIDLIYGSPWEAAADWRATLETAIDIGPDHVAAYALTVEAGTPLHTLVATGRVPDVDPDIQADRHEVASEMLGAAAFDRYEISNWAQPGHASTHNVLYWCAGEYLGFGAGAHGYLEGHRFWSVRLPRDFVARASAGESVEAGRESLAAGARAGEALMLGMRLASGIDTSAFVRIHGSRAWERRRAAVVDLVALGLVETDGARVRLTRRGTLMANEVGARLL